MTNPPLSPELLAAPDTQPLDPNAPVRIVNGQSGPRTDDELAALQAERAAWAQRQAVPEVVTMRQARLALLGAGLLSQVDVTVNAMPAPHDAALRIWWEYSTTVERNNATVLQLASALQLTSQQLDALFVAAAGL